MIELTELRRDAVVEILNIAIGRAAAALNRLVDEEIHLTVPRVAFVDRNQAGRLIDDHTGNGAVAVVQEFSGPFSGDALLIFPEEKSLELARAVIGEGTALEEMTELEQDALVEVGNIVLNAAIGTIANLLELEIIGGLPFFASGDGEAVLRLGAGGGRKDDLAMFMEVDFELKDRKISGYVLFILDIDSGKTFVDLVDKYVERITA